MALRIGQSRQSVRSRVTNVAAHREIFSKSCQTKPKSDCIYHVLIDLEQQTDAVRSLFQINQKMVNTI